MEGEMYVNNNDIFDINPNHITYDNFENGPISILAPIYYTAPVQSGVPLTPPNDVNYSYQEEYIVDDPWAIPAQPEMPITPPMDINEQLEEELGELIILKQRSKTESQLLPNTNQVEPKINILEMVILKPASATESKPNQLLTNQITTKPKVFECAVCNNSFTSPGHLRRHYTTKSHKKVVEASGELDPALNPEKLWPSTVTPNDSWFQAEEFVDNLDDDEAYFITADVEEVDIAEIPPFQPAAVAPLQSSEKNYHCNPCAKSFSKSCYLTQHRNMCHGGRHFKCSQCGKLWKDQQELEKHFSKHTTAQISRHGCEICNRSYNHRSDLKRHLLSHGDLPFVCNQCGKGFPRRDHLLNHMESHQRKELKRQTRQLQKGLNFDAQRNQA